MALIPDDGEQHFFCHTQKTSLPIIAEPPPSKTKTKTNSEGDSIVVGYGRRIPRWDTIDEPKGKLLYYVLEETFPSGEEDWIMEDAIYFFKQAADAWNDVGFGLSIVPTTKKEEAHFYFRYGGTHPDDTPRSGTDASAFFPHESGDVTVYYAAFRKSGTDYLEKVLMHELGHVLGLRHEFALTDERGTGGRQILGENPQSIMSYRKDKALQQSDKDGIREFYKLADGTMLNGIPVTDYLREPRKM